MTRATKITAVCLTFLFILTALSIVSFTVGAADTRAAPTLTNPGVLPTYPKDSNDQITFHVKYTDSDGDWPFYALVYINDVAHNMTIHAGSDPSVGVTYNLTGKLPAGHHNYYFWFNSQNDTVRLPSSGSHSLNVSKSDPVITGCSVSPNPGNHNERFNFYCTYIDMDDDMPANVTFQIDDYASHDMYLNGSDPSSGIYCHGSDLVGNFPAGNHTYSIWAISADGKQSNTYEGEFYATLGNRKPGLSNPSISDMTPKVNDIVNFTVTYKDLDNDAPDYVRVSAIHEQTAWMYNFSMNWGSTSYSTGVPCWYAGSFPLSGNWEVWFEAESNDDNVILGTWNITVSGSGTNNTIPVLSHPSVSPLNGTANQTQFTYSVHYSDADNHAPTIRHLLINGVAHAMNEVQSNSSYSVGKWYRYTTYLPAGTHNYRFEFCDGYDNVTAPTGSGTYTGPYVGGSGGVNHAPTVNVTVTPYSGTTNTTFTFTASGYDYDGDALSYYWIFSDGMNYTGQTVTRYFHHAGNYSGTGYVYDTSGASDSATVWVHVTSGGSGTQNRAPVVSSSLSGTYSVAKGTTLHIWPQGTYDPDGDALTYYWHMYDSAGNNFSYSGYGFNYTFNTPGNVSVQLTVSDGALTTTAWYTLYVYTGSGTNNTHPVAKATASVYGHNVFLSASGSYDPDGHIDGYTWNVGGTTYSGMYVNKTYKSSGYKWARLTVTDNDGATGSTYVSFYIGVSGGNNGTGHGNDSGYKDTTDVGSHVEVKQTPAGAEVEVIDAEVGFTVTLTDQAEGHLQFVVDSDSPTGKLVVLDIDDSLLEIPDVDHVQILMDGEEITFRDFAMVISASGDEAVYCILIGESGYQLFVYIPHFSEHTIDVKTTRGSGSDPTDGGEPSMVFLAIIAVLLFVAVMAIVVVMVLIQVRNRQELDDYYSDFSVSADEKMEEGNGKQTKIEEDDEDYWDDYL